jgi:hypothetical protein
MKLQPSYRSPFDPRDKFEPVSRREAAQLIWGIIYLTPEAPWPLRWRVRFPARRWGREPPHDAAPRQPVRRGDWPSPDLCGADRMIERLRVYWRVWRARGAATLDHRLWGHWVLWGKYP